MSYGLIYTIPFASFKNEACIIEIEKKDYTGEAAELIPAETPFSVEIVDDDFIYIPTRFSTANICIVGGDYLQSLYSTSYQQYRVTFKRNNIITWCGFIKPELYTQDYSSKLFELEIECQSAMSTLEFIPYKGIGEEGKVFVSLWTLLKNAITLSNAKYNSIVFPHVYSETESVYLSDIDNVLKKMTLSEQNFFDEDDKAMTCKEVLEEICKLLNWTCVDWRGDLYFVDVDHQGDYWQYSLDMKSWEPGKLPNLLNVQKTGFSGSDHSLDLVPGYNKVTVKTSNYPVGSIIPEEKFDAIVKKGPSGRFTPSPFPVIPGVRSEEMIRVGQKETVYSLFNYYEYEQVYLLGSILCRVCIYSLVSQESGSYLPNITEFSYDDCVCIRTKNRYPTDRTHWQEVRLEQGKGVLTFADQLPYASYSGGAFCISGQVAQSNRIDNHAYSSSVGSKSALKLVCKLEISGNFWNGSKWIKTDTTFTLSVNPKNAGYTAIENTKALGMPYDGVNGYIIELPESPIIGPVKFTMYTPQYADDVTAVYLKDFKFVYAKADDSSEDDNSDRYYENVLNEDYINELDEIEFKISSYNNDGACYSKVMIGDKYLEDNLYSVIEEKLIRPEEQLIRRIINRYSDTHIKLTQEIQEVPELTPITRLSDDFMVGKVFINTGGTIDYKQGKFRCIMIEV